MHLFDRPFDTRWFFSVLLLVCLANLKPDEAWAQAQPQKKTVIFENDQVQAICSDNAGNIYLSLKVAPYFVKSDLQGRVLESYDLVKSPADSILGKIALMVADDRQNLFFIVPETRSVFWVKDKRVQVFATLNNFKDLPHKEPASRWSRQLTGLSLDAAGNLLVADAGKNVIWKIDPQGAAVPVAGTGNTDGPSDRETQLAGKAKNLELREPGPLAADATGGVYFLENWNNLCYLNAQGTVNTILVGDPNSYHDGPLPQGKLTDVLDLQSDPEGNLYMGVSTSQAAGRTFHHFSGIRRLRDKSILETLAGCHFRGTAFNQLQGTETFNGKPILPQVKLDSMLADNPDYITAQRLRALEKTQYGLFFNTGEAGSPRYTLVGKNHLVFVSDSRNYAPAAPAWESLGVSLEKRKSLVPIRLTVVQTQGAAACREVILLVKKPD